MRKLDRGEERLLTIMLGSDRPYFPNRDMTNEPFIMDTLNGLVRKKYLSVEMTDDGPAFSLTAYGRMAGGDAA